MKHISSALVLVIFCMTVLLGGCSPKTAEPQTLKIAVLPIMDALPLYVAEKQGYFEHHNVEIEFINVSSAFDRDQLMQSGQIDGMLNELVTTLFYNRSESKIHVVRFARTATSEHPLFRILASKDSGITDVEGLRGVPIAISEGTVIEYTMDRLLQNAGFDEASIATLAVPKIPDRMALLSSGEIEAAVMPDPLASLAMKQGAVNVIDDTSYPEISHSVYTFSNQSLDEKSEAVRAFLAAVEQAVADINNNKQQWEGLMVERQLAPEAVLGSYTIPDFPTAAVPNDLQFQDALAWTQEKGLIEGALSYQDSIDPSFLP